MIKIDGKTLLTRDVFIWLQNQQIYIQGLNQMLKKKAESILSTLGIPASEVLSICFINRLSYRGLPV